MDEVTRRQALKLAATTGAIATGVVAIGVENAEAQDDRARGHKGEKVKFTKSEMETYDKVATVIGKVMDGAYKDIIAKLAGGKVKDLKMAGTDDEVNVTNDELAVFFSIAQSTGMELNFAPKTPKALIGHFYDAVSIPINTTALKHALISGEIGCSGTIRF